MNTTQYSPGLETVIAGETAISTLEHGLSYRGYAIEELAAKGSFEETAYLILHGELPTASELASFRSRIALAARLPAAVVQMLSLLPAGTSLMDVIRSGVSLLAHWDPDTADNSPAANRQKAERLLAQLPVLLGARRRIEQGLPPVAYDAALSFAANVLWLLQGNRPTAAAERAMDATLIMYAEHEFNASTFAARVICSTLSDLHSAITGAIGALKGPLHGGANERVLELLLSVGAPERAPAFIANSLARKERIMGFGHRVYKDGDPRAAYLKPLAAQLAAAKGDDSLERISQTIEETLWREKHLPPNLDWPVARIYHYLGLPTALFTPLFVVSRVTGWSAHVCEQLANNRLMRPRSLYTGPPPRKFTTLAHRG